MVCFVPSFVTPTGSTYAFLVVWIAFVLQLSPDTSRFRCDMASFHFNEALLACSISFMRTHAEKFGILPAIKAVRSSIVMVLVIAMVVPTRFNLIICMYQYVKPRRIRPDNLQGIDRR